MFYSRILVAYDGSTPAKKAVSVACDMAKMNPKAGIVFAHVAKVSGAAMAGMDVDGAILERAGKIRERLQETAEILPNEAKVVILKGSSPADLIINCCKTEGCDLIIMGSRGMGGVKGYLGSVSHAVSVGADVCVLIAKVDGEGGRNRK